MPAFLQWAGLTLTAAGIGVLFSVIDVIVGAGVGLAIFGVGVLAFGVAAEREAVTDGVSKTRNRKN